MLKLIVITTSLCLANTAPNNFDSTAINKFALNLLDNTYAYQDSVGSKNFAISPISIWSIFALLAEGSSGDTFQELVTSLRLPSDPKATQALQLAVKKVLKGTNDVTLRGQSAMFNDGTLDIHEEFCDTASKYGTDIYAVDPKNTTKLADDINYYICLATEGKITVAVKPQMLEELRMILVNTLYFKASWTVPFDPSLTKEAPFYNSQGKTIGSVNMMFQKASHLVVDSNQINAQVLEMPYGKNEQFSMVILLPFEPSQLKKLIKQIGENDLDWMRELRTSERHKFPEIEIKIPRFEIKSQIDLIQPLQYTGIHSIFDSAKAQLPGVSDSPLFVSKGIQSVNIKVNEKGTVAAAATVIGIENRIFAQRFEANREFIFLILERKTNMILFSGVYSEPQLV